MPGRDLDDFCRAFFTGFDLDCPVTVFTPAKRYVQQHSQAAARYP